MKNFPDDPRLAHLPEEIRNKFRGRSVPSPNAFNHKERDPIKTVVIERAHYPFNLKLEADQEEVIGMVSSEMALDKFVARIEGDTARKVEVTSSGGTGKMSATFIIPRHTVYVNEGYQDIKLAAQEGDLLSIKAIDEAVNVIGTMEFIKEGGTLIRADRDAPAGPPSE